MIEYLLKDAADVEDLSEERKEPAKPSLAEGMAAITVVD